MRSSLWFSLFLLVLRSLSLLTPIHAIILDVPSGKVKCLTEDLHNGTVSYAQYRVVNASASHLTISTRVSGPNGEELHHLQSVESGQFSFEVGTAGRHTACFWSPKFELTASVSVDVEWNLRTRARSPRDATKKGNLEAMGLELKKLENAVKLIHDEMIFLREREADTQMFNKETASKMSSLSLLSLAICLGVASLQIWHLKAFFQSKKIL
ncbi:Transmembrane emp24 domain-containing protein p24delta9 [Rhynchospora pubera]|uniref:Transmembrane emp24 domain-containing protein p24delta9 n=1 Tax=Rhynchospora pubera TaxID=906938 RepID=A0AAV8HHT6_9POAL|nr:Transmembrane emp24 domain-containing protein p24delta9 [Rhynchospora pubera]KAJ4817034.1 Transmembrane emp24 domain-containing protein p24delta9 [Rhynchospora pubera]